jgi:hypothetical protein
VRLYANTGAPTYQVVIGHVAGTTEDAARVIYKLESAK